MVTRRHVLIKRIQDRGLMSLCKKSICKANDYGMVIYEMDNGGLEKYDTQVMSETHLNITKKIEYK